MDVIKKIGTFSKKYWYVLVIGALFYVLLQTRKDLGINKDKLKVVQLELDSIRLDNVNKLNVIAISGENLIAIAAKLRQTENKLNALLGKKSNYNETKIESIMGFNNDNINVIDSLRTKYRYK